MMEKRENTRLFALEVLLDVEKKNIFVKEALHNLLFQKQFLPKQDRAFVTRLVEGVTEYQVRLDYVLDQFSKTPVRKCKPAIRCILRMALYQILYMDSVPEETACDEAVKLAKKKGFRNLTGFVNGVLRNVVRNKDNIQYPSERDSFTLYLSVMYSVPLWLVEKIVSWYGKEKAKTILEAFIEEDRLTIRVNLNVMDREAFIDPYSKKRFRFYRACM